MQLFEIRERVRAALASLADSGSFIETGYFFGSADYEPYGELIITIDGCEYSVQISEISDDGEAQ
jgi:hypothetical protein